MPHPGWLDILWRTRRQLSEDNLSILAAGVAFYAFLAVVPALAAMLALYGLWADPAQIAAHLESLAQVLPPEAMPLVHEQLTRLTANQPVAGWGAALGIALALLSSAKGTKAMVQALNIAYDEQERRGFFKLNAIAIGLTLAGIVTVIALLALVAVMPVVVGFLGLSQWMKGLAEVVRWVVLALLFLAVLAGLYRIAPCRDAPRWLWLSPGAAVATGLWLAGSAAFSLYVSRFAGYEKTYGSLGTVVIFLMWLYLTMYVVLLGAELNTELERQTVKDTTEGEPRPLGSRGAYAADTVGPERPGT